MEAGKLIEKLSQEQNESSKVVRIALAYAEFASLVKRMRDAQERAEMITGDEDMNFIDMLFVECREAEREVDEHLKKIGFADLNGGEINAQAVMCMCVSDDHNDKSIITGWNPTAEDMLADDWEIINIE